jgi:hypothetical protein
VWALRLAGSPLLPLVLMLMLLLMLLLMLARWVGGAMMIHHPVPHGSTTGWSYHNLSLLCLLVGADHIIHDDDIADKFCE